MKDCPQCFLNGAFRVQRSRSGQSVAADEQESFEVLNRHACGIDIGAASHWVSVPPERDAQAVQEVGCYTPDLEAMATRLKQCQIETVAMESTGVYWIPVFQMLESQGFEVVLVNAYLVKSVPGRKSDVLDCQWLRQLHSYGLLCGSFRPADPICVLRSYIRQRDTLIADAARHIQRMQKALTQTVGLLQATGQCRSECHLFAQRSASLPVSSLDQICLL